MTAENGRVNAHEEPVNGRAALPPGFVLKNPENGRAYRILRTLGSGGFGVTYEAMDPEGRSVAIKEFFPMGITMRTAGYAITVTGDERAARQRSESFVKEAKVLQSLKGLPSVVEIYEIIYANQTAYYVMEYIDGMTMLQYLKQYGPLKPDVWKQQFLQLMESIEVLHDHGVIHRDITPDNIMIRRDNSFKLIDFGSARTFLGNQNLTINVKRGFAPPEQYSESGQGRYTDVFSLASTMYYAYTGKTVPIDRSSTEGAAAFTRELLNTGLSMQQAEAVKKALRVKVAERYQSMEEFQAAFFEIPVTHAPPEKPSKQGSFELASARIQASIQQLKERPAFIVGAGAAFAMAVVIQLLA